LVALVFLIFLVLSAIGNQSAIAKSLALVRENMQTITSDVHDISLDIWERGLDRQINEKIKQENAEKKAMRMTAHD
jgi:hypothetical protein